MPRDVISLTAKFSDLFTSRFMAANKQAFQQVIASSSTQHPCILLHEVKQLEGPNITVTCFMENKKSEMLIIFTSNSSYKLLPVTLYVLVRKKFKISLNDVYTFNNFLCRSRLKCT